MRIAVFLAVGAVIDMPEDSLPIPVPQNPLDELTARLRREARHGRNAAKPDAALPSIAAWMVAAYEECPDRN